MMSELHPVTSESWQMCPGAAWWKYPSCPWIERHGNSGKTCWELPPLCVTRKELCHQAEHILGCSGKLWIHQPDPREESSKHIWVPLPARGFDMNIKNHIAQDELNRAGSTSLSRKRNTNLPSQNVQFQQDLGAVFAQFLSPLAWWSMINGIPTKDYSGLAVKRAILWCLSVF